MGALHHHRFGCTLVEKGAATPDRVHPVFSFKINNLPYMGVPVYLDIREKGEKQGNGGKWGNQGAIWKSGAPATPETPENVFFPLCINDLRVVHPIRGAYTQRGFTSINERESR